MEDLGEYLGKGGQLVLLGARYGWGNVSAVLVGNLLPARAAALDEVRRLVEGTGARFVHLR